MDAHRRYELTGRGRTITRWFRNGRLAEFGEFVDVAAGVAPGVGCGDGTFEEVLSRKFDDVYGPDPDETLIRDAAGVNVAAIRGTVPRSSAFRPLAGPSGAIRGPDPRKEIHHG